MGRPRKRPRRGSPQRGRSWRGGRPGRRIRFDSWKRGDIHLAPDGSDIEGVVFQVPDDWWGFAAVGRDDHPGACVHRSPTLDEAVVLRGKSMPPPLPYRNLWVEIEADSGNGLDHRTFFDTTSRRLPVKRVLLLYPERTRGRLSSVDLEKLRKLWEKCRERSGGWGS